MGRSTQLGGDDVDIALVDGFASKHLEDARELLRNDIDADLSQIAFEINNERKWAVKQCRNDILRCWFIGGLFNYNYEEAQRALVKCITLNPCKDLTPAEANKLLPVLWGSCRQLFKDDFSALFDEIYRYLKTEELFEEEEGDDAPPFV